MNNNNVKVPSNNKLVPKNDKKAQRVQLLSSDMIKDVAKLVKLLRMKVSLLSNNTATNTATNNKIAPSTKLIAGAINKIHDGEIQPVWRLMTTTVVDEFKFVVVFYSQQKTDKNVAKAAPTTP